MDIDLEQLRDLMRAMAEFQMNEMELEKAGERISLRRGGAVVSVAPVQTLVGSPQTSAAAPSAGSIQGVLRMRVAKARAHPGSPLNLNCARASAQG